MTLRPLLVSAALLAAACARADAPAASFATEDATTGWATVSEPLAKALVASGDAQDREMLDDTIRDDGLRPNYRQFLRQRPVRLAVAGKPALFVRPATTPRAAAFYGAHTFRFWFVGAGSKVVFASSADRVAILETAHEGMRDLRVSQCRGGACFETTEVFEHGAYRDGACVTRDIESGRTTPGCQ